MTIGEVHDKLELLKKLEERLQKPIDIESKKMIEEQIRRIRDERLTV